MVLLLNFVILKALTPKISIYSIFKGCKDINILKTLIFPEVQPEGTASLIKGHKVCRQTEKLI